MTIKKQHGSKAKARVALEAVRCEKTLSEIGRAHGVYPIQVGKWRKELLERAHELFTDKRRRTTVRNPEHRVFPYLLRGVEITRTNQVWSTDITYVRMRQGFLYLVAVIDWFSRYVLAWELSNQMSTDFCLEALNRCWRYGVPEIFNSDQGAQFASNRFVECLLARDVKVSMDGRGRCLDNVYIERLWRSVKYEEIYLKDYSDGRVAHSELRQYFNFYNERRLHSSLKYRTPANLYR